MSGLTYSHLDVRFEHRDRSSNRRELKPDMTVSGLSSCPASMSGLRPSLGKNATLALLGLRKAAANNIIPSGRGRATIRRCVV